MRESNFAFPAQNRACVCISSQLYDRRALDTTSALPLFNSLSHLTYLTSTSPRIREILTFDGGLERLVRILRDFCQAPPPPESPQLFYGLLPPPPPNSNTSTASTTTTTKRPPAPADLKSFDRAAAYRFSLAFQCVANIGVRGSEPIRSRVVQAGTLDVVGCVLESWLQSRGFAVLPSSSASGLPRESKEQRMARRQQLAQLQQQQQAAEIARALERARAVQEAAAPLHHSHSHSHSHSQPSQPAGPARRHHPLMSVSAGPSNSTSASDEEMADVSPAQTRPSSSVSMNSLHSASSGNASGADTSAHATPVGSSTPTGTVVVPATRDRSGTVVGPRPVAPWDLPQAAANRRRARTVTQRNRHATDTEDEDVEMADDTAGRRAVGIVQSDADDGGHLNLLIDGIVALGQNDDLAMGAPPGAPGATAQVAEAAEEEEGDADVDVAPTETPRQTAAQLPQQPALPAPTPRPSGAGSVHNTPSVGQRMDDGPYREEDVLIALQLLAYLSKYPHVRQAFYKKRVEGGGNKTETAEASRSTSPVPHRESALGGFARAFVGSGSSSSSSRAPPSSPSPQQPVAGPSRIASASSSASAPAAPTPVIPNAAPLYPRPSMTQSPNIFSLVERFTFRPSANEASLPAPPDFLPPEIQYWAGVIMRNACRKDDSRGGIRQCANMLCGKWEESPRQFAKCRRCRKAKYCGKECQSRAWAEGHRFWCSAREEEGQGQAGQGALVESVPAPAQTVAPTARQTRSVARGAGTGTGTVAPAPSPALPAAPAAGARGGVNSFPGPVPATAAHAHGHAHGGRRRAGTMPAAPPAPPTSPELDGANAHANSSVDEDDMVLG